MDFKDLTIGFLVGVLLMWLVTNITGSTPAWDWPVRCSEVAAATDKPVPGCIFYDQWLKAEQKKGEK